MLCVTELFLYSCKLSTHSF